jgi:hypothetical protein
MEQRLDSTYLRPGPFERAAAIGVGAVSIGTGILLAAWGISFLWRYTPPEIVVRQDKPFVLAQPEPFKIDSATVTVKVEQPSPLPTSGIRTAAKTPQGDAIRREVTEFSTVEHGAGSITTGWNYRDGTGGVPLRQYCYYSAPNFDQSSTRIDIAFDQVPLPNISGSIVPDLQGALAKCQWWKG